MTEMAKAVEKASNMKGSRRYGRVVFFMMGVSVTLFKMIGVEQEIYVG